MIGNPAQIRKAMADLEELMISYQQYAFSMSIDSIFICFMIGYFALKDYSKCDLTFKRYLKLAKGRFVNKENDIEIHTYYYASQWLSSHRKQYLSKLLANYEVALTHPSHETLQTSHREMIHYFDIPVELPNND